MTRFLMRRLMRLLSLLFILLFLVGCGDTIINPPSAEYYDFDVNPNLDIDENGYYHLELTTQGSSNQTLHQFSVDTNHPEDNQYVYWDCDTQYQIDLFGTFEMVDIINHYSYTGDDGIAYTMFGPHSTQCGDTVMVSVSYVDTRYSVWYSDNFSVVLDGTNGECE